MMNEYDWCNGVCWVVLCCCCVEYLNEMKLIVCPGMLTLLHSHVCVAVCKPVVLSLVMLSEWCVCSECFWNTNSPPAINQYMCSPFLCVYHTYFICKLSKIDRNSIRGKSKNTLNEFVSVYSCGVWRQEGVVCWLMLFSACVTCSCVQNGSLTHKSWH